MSDSENIVTLPGVEDIEAEAASWMAVLGREKVGHSERGEFEQWLSQSERHRTAFNELAVLWDDMAILNELDDIAESVVEITGPRHSWWQRHAVMSLAASLLVGIAVAGTVYMKHLDNLNQQDTFATSIGAQRTVQLSDGSTLQLNTDSRVAVEYSRAVRKIRLLQGEAHFDVAKNTGRPFSVYAGSGIVQAVGTAFTVRLHQDNQVEVTVEEGRVALASVESPVKAQSPADKHEQTHPIAELTAGQSAVFNEQVEKLAQMQTPELNRKLSWRQGMLIYTGDPLRDVVSDVSRYTDITIEIADSALRDMPVVGYFRVGEVEGLFDSLELTFGLNVERINDHHVRLSKTL